MTQTGPMDPNMGMQMDPNMMVMDPNIMMMDPSMFMMVPVD